MIYPVIQVQGRLSQRLRAPGGNAPWTGHPPIAGHAHTHIRTHPAWDHVDLPIHLALAHPWDVGGKWSTWRKLMQSWGEQANSTQTMALAGSQFFFLINLIRKQHYKIWCNLRTCSIELHMPLFHCFFSCLISFICTFESTNN